MRALLLLVFLTGCAGMTPQEVRTKGSLFVKAAVGTDLNLVGRCIQKNAENQTDLLMADVRPQEADRVEVVVRANDGADFIRTGTVAVFDVIPSPYLKDGVLIRGRINPGEPNNHLRVFAGYTVGC